jgi:parallel beta-helix repeat protein
VYWLQGEIVKKTVLLILLLLVSLTIVYFAPVKALPDQIIIQPNGDVTPSNAPIQRAGNTYTITADLNNNPIVVKANNVTINGANHTLRGPGLNQNLIALNLTATNVTVQNLQITNWKVGILSAWNNNTITNNQVQNSDEGIAVYADDYVIRQNTVVNCTTGLYINGGAFRPQGDNNIVNQNRIRGNQRAFDIVNNNGTTVTANDVANNGLILVLATNTAHTLFYSNNFTSNGQVLKIPFGGPFVESIISFAAGQWDNGTVGNYWSDYRTTYPNATEIDHSGIGNSPYKIAYTLPYTNTDENGTVTSGTAVLGTAVDNYPLMAPTSISTPTSTTSPTPSVPEFPTQTVLLLSIAALCSVALLTLKFRVKPCKQLIEKHDPK